MIAPIREGTHIHLSSGWIGGVEDGGVVVGGSGGGGLGKTDPSFLTPEIWGTSAETWKCNKMLQNWEEQLRVDPYWHQILDISAQFHLLGKIIYSFCRTT